MGDFFFSLRIVVIDSVFYLSSEIQHLQGGSFENKGSPKEANQIVEEIGEEMTNTIPQLNIQEVEKEDVDIKHPDSRESK